jgi:uncharacterized protein YndB with AHSA1/START domain
MIQSEGFVVRIERTFNAPAEAVFDAWTSPEVMRRWFHVGPDWETPETEVDLRVGGEIRVVMRRPDGTEAVLTCTFSDDPSNEQLVELSFSESGGSTTVVLVNSGISKDERRDAQDYGWRGCFENLDRVLAG